MNKELLLEALRWYDTKEHRGRRHNATIVGWLRNVLPWANKDEISWCSAFLFSCAVMVDADRPDPKRGAAAISWRSTGTPVEGVRQAQIGDVVILYRGKRTAWTRHVGLYVRHDRRYVWLLGGNQGDSVSIRKFPIGRVDCIRRPCRA